MLARAAIRTCREKGKGDKVRLSDNFVLNVIIGDPDEPHAWARVQPFLPYKHGEKCPSFVVQKKDRPELFNEIKESFEAMWEAGKIPPTTGLDQEEERPAKREQMPSVVATLIQHREWAVHHLLNMPVQSDADLARWLERRDWWRKEVVGDLRKVCSDSEVSRFDVVGRVTLGLHANAYGLDHQGLLSEHNKGLTLLNRDLEMLVGIIDEVEKATRATSAILA